MQFSTLCVNRKQLQYSKYKILWQPQRAETPSPSPHCRHHLQFPFLITPMCARRTLDVKHRILEFAIVCKEFVDCIRKTSALMNSEIAGGDHFIDKYMKIDLVINV